MILREGFIAKCEQWRDSNSDDECYEDEYEDRDLTELDTFSKSYVSALASITSEIILFT